MFGIFYANPKFQTYPRLGYLARNVKACTTIPDKDQADVEDMTLPDEDDASASPQIRQTETLEVWQSVVYSVTYQVPVFYFSAHYASAQMIIADLKSDT